VANGTLCGVDFLALAEVGTLDLPGRQQSYQNK